MLRPLFSLWTSILCVLFCRTAESKEKKRPNILIILADDVGTGDLPRYWNSGLVHMPNINGLSEKGVLFTDAHGTPLCAPSRYMLLSGNYQHRGRHYNGRWNIGYQHNQFQSHQKSIAEVLRDKAGYHTAMFGKWHLGAKVPPDGLQNKTHFLTSNLHNWTLPLIDGPQDIGFSKSYVTTGGIQEAPYSFFRNGLLTTNITSRVSYWEEGKYRMPSGDSIIRKSGEGDIGWDSTVYNQILVNETSQFINDHLEDRSEDPFFAYVALGSVHYPHSPPTKYSDGSPIAGEYPTAHMDLLLELDKVVGSLVSLVERKGISNETIIIFSSDNGGLKWDSNFFHHSSGPLRGSKGQIYEGGHRVPLIIRYDGVYPTNEKRSNLVGLNDIFSTICDIIGIDVPDGSAQDSVSFAHYIRASNNTSGLRSTLSNWDYSKGTLQSEAVRFGHLKLIRHFGAGTGTDELYDLASDLSETKNLIDNVDYADIISEMASKAKEVGPCPDNVKGPIVFSTGREVTCGYFRTNTIKRCARWRIEGELYCNKICGRFKKMCKNIRASTSNNEIEQEAPAVIPTLSSHPSRVPTTAPTVCEDDDNWMSGGTVPVLSGLSCDALGENESYCAVLDDPQFSNFSKSVSQACCICGGSKLLSPSPSIASSDRPSVSPSNSASALPTSQPSQIALQSPSTCVDEPDWRFVQGTNVALGCSAFDAAPSLFCKQVGDIGFISNGKSVYEACCVCGGGQHVEAASSQRPSQVPTSSSSAPSLSIQPSFRPSASPSSKPSNIPSNEPTECADDPDWKSGNGSNTIFSGLSCETIGDSTFWCEALDREEYKNFGKLVSQACCTCGWVEVFV